MSTVQKIQYATRLQIFATQLAQIADVVGDLNKLFFDRGYNVGGSDPIIDTDVQGLGLTQEQITLLLTLLQQFDNFCSGQAVAAADYKSTMNKVRTDV